jgi:hypothetical protein
MEDVKAPLQEIYDALADYVEDPVKSSLTALADTA